MLTEIAREQMVEQQVRAWGVLDERILGVLRHVPRERFVPPQWRELAFADCALSLQHGKHMLRPMWVGRILQTLAIRSRERVLEIGTGSGFLSACMARLGGSVRSLELHADIAEAARANLRAATPDAEVDVVEGDGLQLNTEAGYDAIVLTGSLPIYQSQFERALRPGGRLFVIVGSAPVMQANLIRRAPDQGFSRTVLFETCVEALEHAPRPPAFGF